MLYYRNFKDTRVVVMIGIFFIYPYLTIAYSLVKFIDYSSDPLEYKLHEVYAQMQRIQTTWIYA